MAQLQTECKKRKIEFNASDDESNLISFLIADDKTPLDWGRIYSRLLYHTSMTYEEIAHRTIPQIEAILDGASENIPIKIGMPSIFGTTSLPSPNLEKESTQEDVESFFCGF